MTKDYLDISFTKLPQLILIYIFTKLPNSNLVGIFTKLPKLNLVGDFTKFLLMSRLVYSFDSPGQYIFWYSISYIYILSYLTIILNKISCETLIKKWIIVMIDFMLSDLIIIRYMVWIRFFCITTVKYREFYLIKDIYLFGQKKNNFRPSKNT